MKDYIILGSVPWGEKGEKVNSDDYIKQASTELEVFKDMLVRIFGEGEDSNHFDIKTFNYKCGEYYQAVVYFDYLDEKSIRFVKTVDEGLHEKWDDVAIYKLKKMGYKFNQ